MALNASQKVFKDARRYLVGGVNSPVRAFNSVGGQPLVMAGGKGARIRDADGQWYTDYCLSWGALIHGHAPGPVMRAVRRELAGGTSFGTTTRAEVEIARFIVRHVPSIDQVRFVNSGTEATMSAIRLARGFTGRKKVVKFDGCYHGHFDDLLVKAGSGVAKLKGSSSLGITPNHIRETISLPFNDTAMLASVLDRDHKDIACVIVEPVPGNMGVVPPVSGFLETVRRLTRRYKIVLIFDEIMTGFRTHMGCVQAETGIIPDMTCLGKIIGGGFPVGAYGGRKEIMRRLAPSGGVYQAGTFSGNPVAMRAGLASLSALSARDFNRLNSLCRDFTDRVNTFFADNGIGAHMAAYRSMMSLRFRKNPVLNYKAATAASDKRLYARLFWALIDEGVYWPPAELEAFFVSTAHRRADLQKLLAAIQRFFKGPYQGRTRR